MSGNAGFGLWAMAALIAAGGGFLFVAAFRNLRRGRIMRDTPTSRIRSAAQGYTELEGRARLLDGPPVICPLTAQRCVWWRYFIEVRSSTGRGARWRSVEKRTSDDLFCLEDETGRCVIDPEGAQVIPSKTYTWYGRTRRPERGPAAGGGLLGAFFGGPYRYREQLIEVGAPLYALGDFRTQDPLHTDDDAQVRLLIREWKQDQDKLLERFDVDGDGRIDAVEWEAARRVARMRVRREQAQAPPAKGLHVLARGQRGHPFLLSGKSQAQVSRWYLWGAAICFAGFLMAGCALLWLLADQGVF